jgi:hypothetical protein
MACFIPNFGVAQAYADNRNGKKIQLDKTPIRAAFRWICRYLQAVPHL